MKRDYNWMFTVLDTDALDATDLERARNPRIGAGCVLGEDHDLCDSDSEWPCECHCHTLNR